jgi:8-oxo-dGTP diphosphatase
MQCRVHPLNSQSNYRYVVVCSRYRGQMLLSRHCRRETWETQGGHIEPGETPLDAARRELYEESGATAFRLWPLCDYWAADETSDANGMVFVAEVTELGPLPPSEMAEVRGFDALPAALTYPDITPKLWGKAQEFLTELPGEASA